MSKYKIGDKVLVVPKEQCNTYQYLTMEEKTVADTIFGKIVTIVNYKRTTTIIGQSKYYKIKEDNGMFLYTDDDFIGVVVGNRLVVY